MVAKTEEGEISLGNRRLMNERGIDITDFENSILSLEEEGKTVMIVASGDKAISEVLPVRKTEEVRRLQQGKNCCLCWVWDK